MKDIDQIRRENMIRLENECGGVRAAAEKAAMSQAQWSNLRAGAADSKTGKPRGMAWVYRKYSNCPTLLSIEADAKATS